MDKPFDFKALEEKAKAEGLPEAEQLAEKMLKVVCDWADESFALMGGIGAVLGKPAVQTIREAAQKMADKIDGQPG